MTALISGFLHHTISKDGVVTNQKTGKVKAVWVSKAGYKCVDIHESSKASKHYIHRLLAETFLPNPENKRTVNHKNGNKLDNHLDNLEWSTDSENIYHAYANNLNCATNKKVTEKCMKEIYKRFVSGENLTSIVADYPFNLSTLSTHLNKYVNEKGKRSEFERLKREQKYKRGTSAVHETIVVAMLDVKTSEYIRSFPSMIDAAKFLGKKTAGPISNNLSGRTCSAYGYKWVRV